MEALFELGMAGPAVHPVKPSSLASTESIPRPDDQPEPTVLVDDAAAYVNQPCQTVEAASKSKKSRKRQRDPEQDTRLRDFGPDRQSGRLRILKEYPPEPTTDVDAVRLPAKEGHRTGQVKKVKRKEKAKRERRRHENTEISVVGDSAAMKKGKATRKTRRRETHRTNQDRTAQQTRANGTRGDASLDGGEQNEVLVNIDNVVHPKSSRLPEKWSEIKRRHKESKSATASLPDLILGASVDDIQGEVSAVERPTLDPIVDAPPPEYGEEIVAIQSVHHASLESMSCEAPFGAPSTIRSESITTKRKSDELVSQATEKSIARQIFSKRLDQREMNFTKKGGIKSSTFARVMRLVADLPAVQSAEKPLRRERAAHRPPVWADSRQELCEALPYYRAFQSGLYMHQKVAFGYLLDGFPAPRDVCAHNARVIISHGGGQCIRPITEKGQKLPPVLAGDQLISDARVSTLVRAWERKIPLVLLAGSGYALLPFKLDCSYVVLGWYWVSQVWTEAEPVAEGVRPPTDRDWYKRVKVRFDWVDSQGEPWWEQASGTPPTAVTLATEVAQSPEARRVAVTELVDPFDESSFSPSRPRHLKEQDTAVSPFSLSSGPTMKPGLSRRGSPFLKGTEKDRDDVEVGPVDPQSGLLTPPITPTLSEDSVLGGGTQIAVIGHSTACDSQPMRRRYPGDFVLASFGEKTTLANHTDTLPLLSDACHFCKKSSPQVYREGWICLTMSCTAYWMLKTSVGFMPISPSLVLFYDPAFLRPLPTSAGIKIPYDIIPPRPRMGIPDETGPGDSAGSRSLWRGWVCEDCGRANCRFRWEVWQCLSCNRLLAPIDPHANVVSVDSVAPPIPALLGNPMIDPDSGIIVEMRRVEDPAATVMIYRLPESIGTVYHFINDNNDFADGIFNRYQREAASTRVPLFQRRPLNAHQIRGQLLAQHFAVNSGASYKYNVDSLSLSFDESPSSVIQALEAITERAEKVVGHRVEFNEVLSVLYREGQKMSWHDDGEPGLGPVVAGLSLGSDAVISWRRKSVPTTTNATYLKGMPDPRKTATPPIALSLVTSHGDLVMMEGRDMQKKYVHRVIPSGFRVAATARVIG